MDLLNHRRVKIMGFYLILYLELESTKFKNLTIKCKENQRTLKIRYKIWISVVFMFRKSNREHLWFKKFKNIYLYLF